MSLPKDIEPFNDWYFFDRLTEIAEMTLAKGPTSQESGPGPRLQVTIGGRAQRIFSEKTIV